MCGIIEKIRFYPAKGKNGIELVEGHLIKHFGLEGDYHAKGGERQISILFSELKDRIINSKEQGLCFDRFRENITISGLKHVTPGVQLAIGGVVLEITNEIKNCHEECSFFEADKNCPLIGLNLFAKVVESGFIRTGDTVEIKNACLDR